MYCTTPGKHCAELIADALGAIGLGGLVERQQRGRRRGQPIGSDVALREHVFRHHNGCHRVRPAGIERQMGDDLRNLRRLHAVVERKLQVIRQRDRLIAPDQRGERDDAAIAQRKAGALPHLTEQAISACICRAPAQPSERPCGRGSRPPQRWRGSRALRPKRKAKVVRVLFEVSCRFPFLFGLSARRP